MREVGRMAGTRHLHPLRPGQGLGHGACTVGRDGCVVRSMDDQGRHMDVGQARADVIALGQRQKALPQVDRSEEHTSELQSPCNLVCRLLLEKKKKTENIAPLYTRQYHTDDILHRTSILRMT